MVKLGDLVYYRGGYFIMLTILNNPSLYFILDPFQDGIYDNMFFHKSDFMESQGI